MPTFDLTHRASELVPPKISRFRQLLPQVGAVYDAFQELYEYLNKYTDSS